MRIILIGIFTLLSNFASAQSVEMADQFRAEGKIYVVLAVIGVLLIGFFIYLFVIDKKLSRLEKKVEEQEH